MSVKLYKENNHCSLT